MIELNALYEPDRSFTRAELLGTPEVPAFSGETSMFRRRYRKEFAGADLVFLGAPLDMTTTGRPGARLGPRALRAASALVTHSVVWPWQFDPFETLAAVDGGDIVYDPGSLNSFLCRADEAYLSVTAIGAMPATLGGDQFASYPALKALAGVHGPLGLLHFDAHSDTWVNLKRHHGSVFFHGLRDKYLDRARLVQVGIRTDNPLSHKALILTAPDVQRRPAADIAVQVADHLGDHRPVYVSFDIDCLDPAMAPGTGTPVPGGLTVSEVKQIIYELAAYGLNIVGVDLVEVAPPHDISEITALAGASVLLDLICLMAAQRLGPARPDDRCGGAR